MTLALFDLLLHMTVALGIAVLCIVVALWGHFQALVRWWRGE